MSAPVGVAPGAYAPRPRESDVGRLLGIGTRAAWLVYALFAACASVFALATLGRVESPLMSALGLLVVLSVAILILRDSGDPMPLRDTVIVSFGVPASAAIVAWQVVAEDPGREAWYVVTHVWVLFFMALRGRVGWAWGSFAMMLVVQAVWALSTGRDVLGEVLAFQTSAAVLFVCTLFARGLRRASARINELGSTSVRLAESAATLAAERDTRETRMAELAAEAGPLLTRIIQSRELGQDDRREYALAEANLRDSVRGRSLMTPAIAAATRSARARGVRIELIDSRGRGLTGEGAMDRFLAQATRAINEAREGTLAVRLWPEHGAVAASISAQIGQRSGQVDFGEDGLRLDAS